MSAPPDPARADGWPDPLARLAAIVARLRGPGGCPWDLQQTHLSLRSALVEECFELIEAIENADDANLREELGDLLLHVVMHSQMARERGAFDLAGVAHEICEKLVRRHPHVFGAEHAHDPAAVLARWEEIKRAEKQTASSAAPQSSSPPSVMDRIPRGLPSLPKAFEAQKQAARLGLDWPEPASEGVLQKLSEEIAELRAAAASSAASPARVAAEIGDILFTAVNLARVFGADPDHALRDATTRFITRVRLVEQLAARSGVRPENLPPEELDKLWQQAKADTAAPSA